MAGKSFFSARRAHAHRPRRRSRQAGTAGCPQGRNPLGTLLLRAPRNGPANHRRAVGGLDQRRVDRSVDPPLTRRARGGVAAIVDRTGACLTDCDVAHPRARWRRGRHHLRAHPRDNRRPVEARRGTVRRAAPDATHHPLSRARPAVHRLVRDRRGAQATPHRARDDVPDVSQHLCRSAQRRPQGDRGDAQLRSRRPPRQCPRN